MACNFPTIVRLFFEKMLSSHGEPSFLPNVFESYILNKEEKAYRINHAYDYYKTYLHYICRHFAPYTIYNRVKIGKGKKE